MAPVSLLIPIRRRIRTPNRHPIPQLPRTATRNPNSGIRPTRRTLNPGPRLPPSQHRQRVKDLQSERNHLRIHNHLNHGKRHPHTMSRGIILIMCGP